MNNSAEYSKYYDHIAEYVLSHYVKRQSNDSELKSLQTRISNAKREIDNCANAFIEAKNPTLREKIEEKIASSEKHLDYLKSQKAQLELEKNTNMTKKEALVIVEKYMNVNEQEHAFKRRFIDVTIKKVIVWDDGLTIFLDLIDDKEEYIH